ncbi:MAG: tryptophan 7-halogenase [Burkholderiales bacterium]|nr:tryptophan 7-halogenase [Burkholderiales bacterium]
MKEIFGVRHFDIMVVGGGTAGWLSANLLQALLNQQGMERFRITLVESPDTPRIGVGEAVLPTLRQTLEDIGLAESTFMAHTNATFKHAIRFEGWLDGRDSYYHPFEAFEAMGHTGPGDYYGALMALARQRRVDLGALWFQTRDHADAQPYAYATGIQPYLCDAHKAPRAADDPDYTGRVNYAYHTDAERFADLLAEHGRGQRISHLVDHVTEVEPDGAGGIAAVHTRNNGRLAADLFVDCTGFLALMIEKTLHAGFESYADWLLCDRAIAMPTKARSQPRPFTTCTALQSGWMFSIDLTSRTGNGYVYSSRHIDDDAAEAELRARLGPETDGVQPRRLRMQVGRRREAWKANCVAIGLAAGFIEPLESTGIYLIERGARLLCELLSDVSVPQSARDLYNERMRSEFEAIRDFVVAHYCLTKRHDTPFWRDVQRAEHIPPALARQLELWRRYIPSAENLTGNIDLFDHQNYRAVLFGMGWQVQQPAGRHFLREPLDAQDARKAVWTAAERALEQLPAHKDAVQATVGRHRVASSDVHELPFQRGIRLAALAADPARLQLSGGTTTPVAAGCPEHKYHQGARVPKSPWRPVSPAECAALTHPTAACAIGDFVAVVPIAAGIVEAMRSAAADVVAAARREPLASEQVAGVRDENPVLGKAVARLAGQYGDTLRALGLIVNSPGWATITGDKFDSKRIGLHFDSWSRLPVARRAEADNRICINLGTQSRRLLLVNVPMAAICRLLDERGIARPAEDATEIGRTFMRAFPNYPVVAVEVRPGEAYIAPTENVIHDGNSEGMGDCDVTFTAIGRFGIEPVLSSRSPAATATA